MNLNIPKAHKKRIVIVGAGFGGIELAKRLSKSDFQIVLLDRENFHQFPPLLYQVATAGLEPTAIAFPIRKLVRNRPNVYFRLCEVREVVDSQKYVKTSIGNLCYDYLVLAAGTDTNYFGMEDVRKYALPLKTVSEALSIRNYVLKLFEKAIRIEDEALRQQLMNVAIVGGGPTGVELAGAFAELRNKIFPKDYWDC